MLQISGWCSWSEKKRKPSQIGSLFIFVYCLYVLYVICNIEINIINTTRPNLTYIWKNSLIVCSKENIWSHKLFMFENGVQ